MNRINVFQSLASSVVLLNLSELRKRPELFSAETMVNLKKKYGYAWFCNSSRY